jgi:hypothetical protein
MKRPLRDPGTLLRRAFENAGILACAGLLAMSLALGRAGGALLWGGALMVFLAHAWQARRALPTDATTGAGAERRCALLRWAGLLLAVAGAALLVG